MATLLDAYALSRVAEQLSQLGAMLLITAFILLFLLGMGLAAKLMLAALSAYFSVNQRLERRLLFYQNKRTRLERLYRFKKNRLLYYHRLYRKHLHRKHDGRPTVS